MENESTLNSPDLEINTRINADKTFTTGNYDKVDNFEALLPNYDLPVIEQNTSQMVKKHHQFLDSMINILNPDFFSEDPKMFLGDHETYFKIVRKRSILFYYCSRVILYGTIIYMILKFILKKMKDNFISQSKFDNTEYKVFVWFQTLSLFVIMFSGIALFVVITEPKQLIDDSAGKLIFGFRQMKQTSESISEQIQNINTEKLKIHLDSVGQF